MYRVTVFIGDCEFSRDCKGLVKTFEAVKAVIKNRPIEFPDQERALEEYYKIIAHMAPGTEGRCTGHENYLFRIEVIEEAPAE